MPVKTTPWGTYTMWQFTGDDMDRNLINVDAEGWKRLAKGNGKVTPAPAPKPQPRPQAKNTWVDDLGVTWYKETGSFTITDPMGIWLRWGATVKSTKIAALPRGSVVKYDAYCYSGGYVWIRQPRGNGQYGYLPTGEAKGNKRVNYWGTFK